MRGRVVRLREPGALTETCGVPVVGPSDAGRFLAVGEAGELGRGGSHGGWGMLARRCCGSRVPFPSVGLFGIALSPPFEQALPGGHPVSWRS